MPSSGLLLHPPTASSLVRPSNRTQFDFYPSTKRRSFLYKSFRCKASSSSFSVTDFDLYDLLGIDSTSDQAQIKTAYRSLQKRCHPDIAGPSGHEMAIILNDVYSLLSDPVSRSAYDKEQAKMAEFEGYSGKPLYSKWFGSESEERAVFVDEIKCVGCLKCALLAEKTFAIESVYGRARVVAQWADPEDKILDAMQACPVDCISMVERSNLAALEYLMSKQPRGNARTNPGRGMVDVKKFQSKLQAAKNKESIQGSREAAFHAIRSMSNWFYWQPPKGGNNSLIHIGESKSRFDTSKLHEAAAAARQGFWSSRNAARTYNSNGSTDDMEYYWTPMNIPYEPQASVMDDSNVDKTTAKFTRTTSTRSEVRKRDLVIDNDDGDPRNPWSLTSIFPMATAILAAVIVRLQGAEGLSNGGYDAGIQQSMAAGPLPLEIVNSSWLQIILAGFTWYLIGSAGIGLVKAITNKQKIERKQDRW